MREIGFAGRWVKILWEELEIVVGIVDAEDGEVDQVSDDSQLAGRRAGSVIEAMAGTG